MIFFNQILGKKNIFTQDFCAKNKYDSYLQTLHLAEILKMYSE